MLQELYYLKKNLGFFWIPVYNAKYLESLTLVFYFFLTNNMESCLRKVLTGVKTHWDWEFSMECNLVFPQI